MMMVTVVMCRVRMFVRVMMVVVMFLPTEKTQAVIACTEAVRSRITFLTLGKDVVSRLSWASFCDTLAWFTLVRNPAWYCA